MILKKIYGNQSLALVTDCYQFTAAYAFWKAGLHNTKTCFHMFHRKSPFHGGYALCTGLEYVQDWVSSFKLDTSDLDYLSSLVGNDGEPLFQDDKFIKYLSTLSLNCDIDAPKEGSIIFPHQPMLRTIGNVVECLLVESFALCIMNSQSLFSTLASRMVRAADGDPVLDGGLRRAQGIDGALSATRACYIGGISGTSNLWAGKLLGIKAGGTMQHAFVMFFDSELEGFETYAKALPNNCIFLVDTYGTIPGIKNAIEVCLQLKQKGYKPIGIRLDSGDLAKLSIEGRKMLDAAALQEVNVGGSNDLNEKIITSLKNQGATIVSWVVGTKMITSNDQPAFGGVYKMGARMRGGVWVPKIKLSEQTIKTSNPGILNVLRYENSDGQFIGDMLYDELYAYTPCKDTIVHYSDANRQWSFDKEKCHKLLSPAIESGEIVGIQPSLNEIRDYAKTQLDKLPDEVKRFDNPAEYKAGMNIELHRAKVSLIVSNKIP